MYRFDDIKSACNCMDIARDVLGLEINGFNRGQAIWRGGDGFNVAYNERGFCDHADEGPDSKGSVIDVVALVKFNGDRLQAANFLGEHLGLERIVLKNAGNSRYDKLLDDGYYETQRYNYTDEVGNTAHYVVRLEHEEKKKEFVQGANGRWKIPADATLYPYNLQAIQAANAVFICEGEKAAHAIIDRGWPATTNAGGGGNWRAEYSEYFRGKVVAILRDNDDKGLAHAKVVAKSLMGIASKVFILTTSQDHKGDVYDWFAESDQNTLERLNEMVKATPEATPADLDDAETLEVESPEVRIAKDANKYPLRNFTLQDGVDARGKPKKEKVPRKVNYLMEDINDRLLGFPRRIGKSELFDHDRNTHEIRDITNSEGLFVWVSGKTNHNVEWMEGVGFISKRGMFEHFLAEARGYESISKVPDYPFRNDVYYAHEPLPPPDPDHKYLKEFVAYFNPLNEEFHTALMAFVMAPLFYRQGVSNPLWIVDSEVAGSGKTSLVNKIAELYGEPPVEVKKNEFKKDMQEITKRLVSGEGRNRRVFLVDNVTGVFASEELSGLVTMPFITGKRAYGKGEEKRPNNMTYVITANNASIDNDLSIRAFFIKLKQCNYSHDWNTRISTFIQTKRLNIFADMLDILSNHTPHNTTPCTRFPEFESEVLQAVCPSVDHYDSVIKNIINTRQAANVEDEWGKEIEDELRFQLRELGIDPDECSCWIRSKVYKEWVLSALPETRNVVQFVKNLAKSGHLQSVNVDWSVYPHNGNDRRAGILWLNSECSNDVKYIVLKEGKKILFKTV